jgi:endonuclease III
MWTPEQEQAVQALKAAGEAKLRAPRTTDEYTEIPEANRLLYDLEHYPHLFVLGCLMDIQIKFEKAWAIPYLVGKEIGGFEFCVFKNQKPSTLERIFRRLKLHRFPEKMAQRFYDGIRRIERRYDSDAGKIWQDKPKCAAVIRRFLEFDGAGVKIATMATNILWRNFKIPMTHLSSLDISPDRHAIRWFVDNNFLRDQATEVELIYLARELCPDYPGVLDIGAFEGGKAEPKKSPKEKRLSHPHPSRRGPASRSSG